MDTLKKKNEEVLSSLEKKYQNEKLNKEKQILAEISKLAKSSDLKKDNEIVANDREINVKNQITEFFSWNPSIFFSLKDLFGKFRNEVFKWAWS